MSTAEQIWIRPVVLKNILFAMDLSESALIAFQCSARLAMQYGGKIVIAHVITATESKLQAAPSYQLLESKMEIALRGTDHKLGNVPHQIMLMRGEVSSGVLSATEKVGVDLIVLGTHGWHGVHTLLKGSTARTICSLAARPVLTVGPNVKRSREFHTILYATDFSDAAAHALPYATSLADTFGAKLILLHVNEWSSTEPPAEAAAKTTEFVHEQLRYMGSSRSVLENCEVVVDFGRRADLIVATAQDRTADLIVMGTHVRRGLKSRIAAHLPGSVSYEVTSRVHNPVLTIPFEV